MKIRRDLEASSEWGHVYSMYEPFSLITYWVLGSIDTR